MTQKTPRADLIKKRSDVCVKNRCVRQPLNTKSFWHGLMYLRYIYDLFFICKGTEGTTIIHKRPLEFLDTKIYKDTNGKLFLIAYRNQQTRQNYLHFKSAHPPSLKKSIAQSQVLRISNICTETNETYILTKHLAKLKEAFLKHGYQEKTMHDQFNRLNHRKQQAKKKEKSTQIPLIMTYNQTLPNFRKILSENLSWLEINNSRLKHVFKEQPIIAYRRNKTSRHMIRGTNIKNDKVV